jgi:addiction module HigA family antidote
MIRIPTHRALTYPGEMLLEEFLTPLGLTQRDLAQAIHIPYQRVNEIINGRRGSSADFRLNVQLRWDLYFARQVETDELEAVKPYSHLQPAKGWALHEHQIHAYRPSRRRPRRPG